MRSLGLVLGIGAKKAGPAVPTAPRTFTDNMWALNDAGTGGSATISISALPSDGNSTITALQYQIGAGAWTALADVTAGDYTIGGFEDGVSAAVGIRAVNAIGNGAGSATKSVTTSAGVVLTLRQQIENLRDGNTPNGRQSTAGLSVAAPGNIPPGCTYSSGVFTFSTNSATLEDWDFTGYQVTVTGSNQTIQNCYWGPQENHNALYFLQLNASCSGFTFRYNTMDGFDGYGKNSSGGGLSTLINSTTTGSGASATGPQNWLIEYNRFLNVSGDVFKSAGNGTCQWNYFGPPVNYPAGTALYNAGTTYALGAYVLNASNELFVSLQAGNTGNALPANRFSSNAFWDGLDPHCDAITQTACDGAGITYTRNLFDWDATRVERGLGLAQVIRVVRNTGDSLFVGPTSITSNVISAPYESFYALQVQHIRGWFSNVTYDSGDFAAVGDVYYVSLAGGNLNNPPASSPTFWEVTTNINAPGPISVMDNWLAKGSGGLYFTGSATDNAIDFWVNNRDTVTDALVTSPVLRVAPDRTILAFMSQSEPAYTTERSAFYRTLSPPTLRGTADFWIYQRDGGDPGTGISTAETSTTKTKLSSGNISTVNPAMVVIANALDYIFPASKFALVEMMETGTSRTNWVDDADTARVWERSADMIAEAETDFGVDITRVAEFWYAADYSAMPNWLNNMAPIYFGENPNGTNFTLGNTRSTATIDTGAVVDHCLWDFESASPDVKGRGLFKRTTPLDIVRKGPWSETNASPWTGIDNFVADSRFQALGGNYGPPAFGWISDGHPVTTDPDGQFEAAFDFLFPSFLRAKGLDIQEPYFDTANVQIGPAGAYLDIPAILPNGGVLSTKRKVKGRANPASPSIYWQEVMGFEILRTGDVEGRFPICRPGAAGIATKYQGLVTIQNNTTIRITPEVAFAPGDAVTFFYGPGFCRSDGAYVYPDNARDLVDKFSLDVPLEHVSSYTDPSATHKFCGFQIKTFGGPFVAPGLPAPTTWFTMGATGPVFRDPVAVPANTTAIEYRFQVRVPASVASVGGSRMVATQEANGFDVGLTTNGGATAFFVSKVENNVGAAVTPSPNDIIPTPQRDTWYEVIVEADLVNRVVRRTVNGTPLADLPLTGPTDNATFQTSPREISFLGTTVGTTPLHQGVQVAYIEVWFTTSGSKTLRKRIAGNAATVNAETGWTKLGGNAT